MSTESEVVEQSLTDDRQRSTRPTFYTGTINERTSDAMANLKCALILALMNAGVVDMRAGMDPTEMCITLNDTRVRVEMNDKGMKSSFEIDISEQVKAKAAIDSLSAAAKKCN